MNEVFRGMRPLVVGYKGEIGSFILNSLLREMDKAADIYCVDAFDTEHEVIDRIRKSSDIFLCVPLGEEWRWILKYNDYLKGKIIFEQSSLKEWFTDLHSKFKKDIVFINMHILFRPSATPDPKDREVCLVGEHSYNHSIEYLIRALTDCSRVNCFRTVREHDIAMASNQALVHKVIPLLADQFCAIGNTYMCKKILELADRIEDNPELSLKLQQNPHLKTVLREFKRDLK